MDRVYDFTLTKVGEDLYSLDCNSLKMPDGSLKLLHNEVAVDFKVTEDGFQILSGWHIGTEDFDFEEGDSWDDYVEYYHPGITEQVRSEMKRMEECGVDCNRKTNDGQSL